MLDSLTTANTIRVISQLYTIWENTNVEISHIIMQAAQEGVLNASTIQLLQKHTGKCLENNSEVVKKHLFHLKNFKKNKRVSCSNPHTFRLKEVVFVIFFSFRCILRHFFLNYLDHGLPLSCQHFQHSNIEWKKKSCSPVYLGQFCQERITFCIFHMPYRRKMKGIYVKLSDIGIEYNLAWCN